MPRVGATTVQRLPQNLDDLRSEYKVVVDCLRKYVRKLERAPKGSVERGAYVSLAGRLNYRKVWLEAVGLERYGVNLERELKKPRS